jgi:predicted transcriptional regulator of viral defense system
MDFNDLLRAVGDLPTFETGLLLAGDANPMDVRKQLSRWTSRGKVYQLRRGLYSLAPPYQKVRPHPFLIANQLQAASYVSLQTALSFYGMIPEHVPVTTSVTTGRPASYQTSFGQFDYRHVQMGWFIGYRRVELGNDQAAFVASPEKALLDLVYLQPGGDTEGYLRSLRLQALDQVDGDQLRQLAGASGKPKLLRALRVIDTIIAEEAGYEPL